MQSGTNLNFPALTGIRAIASSMVFFYHYRNTFKPHLHSVLDGLITEFHTGVLVFFVLSGFLIAYTSDTAVPLNRQQLSHYLLKRLLRIYPFYLLLLLAKYLATGFPSFIPLFLNITLLKGFFEPLALSGITQAWSLTVEITFYVLAPFLFAGIARFGFIKTYLAVFISGVAITGFMVILRKAGFEIYGFMPNVGFWIWSTFFGRCTEFFAGILLALLVKNGLPHWLKNTAQKVNFTLIGCFGFLLLLLAISSFAGNGSSHGIGTKPGLFLHNFVLPAFACFLFYGLIFERTVLSRILSTRLFETLGGASYIFYLIHFDWFTDLLPENWLFPDQNFFVLWLISVLLYLFLEKPFYRFAKQQLARQQFKPQTQANPL